MNSESCLVEGCDGTARAKGWCQAHYMRWWTTGDTGPAVIVRRAKGRVCSVDGCSRKHSGRGFCDGHLQRFKKTGDAGSAELASENWGLSCSVDGCGKRAAGLGLCNAHYLRQRIHGSATAPLPSHPPRWTGDAATYTAMHLRLRKQRGPAKLQVCATCGKPAQHWAYDHADPAEKTEDGKPFSLDPAHYKPMCQPCHRRFDVQHMPVVICSVDGCDQPQKAKALCRSHYNSHRVTTP